ncbi:hypothetical protein [Streptomyces sp. SBT349]|uniref:hypothetical protein n=1 Tax=Streptomyces sp. SBT349 TaxID=1580539 RepID=UPI00066B061E|nr:hypothetical protein [Streptomyces sp. SBT349]
MILFLGGDGDPPPGYYLGGLQVAFSAVEALRRTATREDMRNAAACAPRGGGVGGAVQEVCRRRRRAAR